MALTKLPLLENEMNKIDSNTDFGSYNNTLSGLDHVCALNKCHADYSKVCRLATRI
jgi:hypothetical protein